MHQKSSKVYILQRVGDRFKEDLRTCYFIGIFRYMLGYPFPSEKVLELRTPNTRKHSLEGLSRF